MTQLNSISLRENFSRGLKEDKDFIKELLRGYYKNLWKKKGTNRWE